MVIAERVMAAEAARVANELSKDLRVAVQTYRFFQREDVAALSHHIDFIAITRLCTFHISMGLAKYVEFYERYKAVLPVSVRSDALAFYRDTKSRHVLRFRNKIAGHIWDKDAQRVVSTKNVMDYLSDVCQGNFGEFLAWVDGEASGREPGGLAPFLQELHMTTVSEYQFTVDEFADHQFQLPHW